MIRGVKSMKAEIYMIGIPPSELTKELKEPTLSSNSILPTWYTGGFPIGSG